MSAQHQEEPLAVRRARELVEACQNANLPAKLLGGIAIYIVSPYTRVSPFQRAYNDVDIAIQNRQSVHLRSVLTKSLGMLPDRDFNAGHGDRRQLYRWPDGMELDVFVDLFEQCQQLSLKPWLTTSDALTLPNAVLLLTKLQIVQINAKDLLDIFALVLHHPSLFEDTILDDLVACNWRWYTAVINTLTEMRKRAPELLDAEQTTQVNHIIDGAIRHLEHLPKTVTWKVRAGLGKRVPWYELPEEK